MTGKYTIFTKIQLIGNTAYSQKIVWKYGTLNSVSKNNIRVPEQPIIVIIAGGVDTFIPLK